MTLKKFVEINKLSMSEAARLIGVDKSQVVKVCQHDYPHWEDKEIDFIDRLKQAGYTDVVPRSISVNTDVLVLSPSVSRFHSLADDLSDPGSTMSSSIGMVIGAAGRGKTHSAVWYARENEQVSYVLYVDGSTKVNLLRDICSSLAYTRPHSFGACLLTLEETCKRARRLVIIDEADKMPVSHLEMLRGVNERCNLPIILVGEDNLNAKINNIPRLRSRIRNPIVVFDAACAADVAAYYHEAAGIDLDRQTAERLVRHAAGGFRTIANDSIAISKISSASGLSAITDRMLDQVCV